MVFARWTQLMRRWSDTPGGAMTKAYESGVVLRTDLRLVDTCEPTIRLAPDFWLRAIRSEHAR